MLTRDDARTVRALASLAKFAPQQMRAAHLIGRAERLAAKIEREAELVEEVLEAFAAPTEHGSGWSASVGKVSQTPTRRDD